MGKKTFFSKVSVLVTIAIGVLLVSFQNCSGGFKMLESNLEINSIKTTFATLNPEKLICDDKEKFLPSI